jgi:transcriptional regulator with XRE-family HTH domain
MRVGVSAAALSKWENGQTRPRSKYIRPLASTLGITISELLGASRPSWARNLNGSPKEEQGEELRELVAECKQRLAELAGTSPANVRIVIEI